uniref:Uncharacterized protein n=1 Tax=Setaria italica TaxID=4555 RepID=K4A3I7_SETIT
MQEPKHMVMTHVAMCVEGVEWESKQTLILLSNDASNLKFI